MVLLDQPPYIVADARPPRLPRQCSRSTGEPKGTYRSTSVARRVVRVLRMGRELHPYRCRQGHVHVGHRP